MVVGASMEVTPTRVLVLLATLGHTVKQVSRSVYFVSIYADDLTEGFLTSGKRFA